MNKYLRYGRDLGLGVLTAFTVGCASKGTPVQPIDSTPAYEPKLEQLIENAKTIGANEGYEAENVGRVYKSDNETFIYSKGDLYVLLGKNNDVHSNNENPTLIYAPGDSNEVNTKAEDIAYIGNESNKVRVNMPEEEIVQAFIQAITQPDSLAGQSDSTETAIQDETK